MCFAVWGRHPSQLEVQRSSGVDGGEEPGSKCRPLLSSTPNVELKSGSGTLSLATTPCLSGQRWNPGCELGSHRALLQWSRVTAPIVLTSQGPSTPWRHKGRPRSPQGVGQPSDRIVQAGAPSDLSDLGLGEVPGREGTQRHPPRVATVPGLTPSSPGSPPPLPQLLQTPVKTAPPPSVVPPPLSGRGRDWGGGRGSPLEQEAGRSPGPDGLRGLVLVQGC